jgi:hypothetical protein
MSSHSSQNAISQQPIYRYQGPPKPTSLSVAQFKRVAEQAMYLIWIDKIHTQDPYNVNSSAQRVNPTVSASSHVSSSTRCISGSGGTL